MKVMRIAQVPAPSIPATDSLEAYIGADGPGGD